MRIRPALVLTVVLMAGTLVAAPTGASPSWRAIPDGIPTSALSSSPSGGVAVPHATPASCYAGRCAYLASMYVEGAVATGTTATLNQARPKVATHERSIAGIVVGSADGRQSVLFGWMVSKTAFGDTVPHIVISSNVNGAPQCINACGFVPVVPSPPKVAVGHTGKFTIKLSKARWLLVYNNKTLGYFKTSHWPANKLARSHIAAAFGEVDSPSKTTPRSDMGNGRLGTSPKSAKVVGMQLLGATGTPTYRYVAIDAPAKYNIGFTNPSCHKACNMNYGGPGF